MQKISWKEKKTKKKFYVWFYGWYRKILNTIWYPIINKNGWGILWCGGMLCGLLEGRILGKRTRGKQKIQLTNDLLEKKNHTDLKKTAEDRNDRTLRRDCYKPV